MAKEIETKFKVADPGAFRKKLGRIQARKLSALRERDVYYSTVKNSFPGTVVRVRSLSSQTGVFTVKLPGRKGDGPFKVRDEYEVPLTNLRAFDALLRKVGFTPCFIKEKIRETYTLRGAKILLDKLPYLGWFIEIEAGRSRIREIAGQLGYTMAEAIPDTYLDLFEAYKRKTKSRDQNLTFRQ